MEDWLQRRFAGLIIRLAGLVLIGLGWIAVRAMHAQLVTSASHEPRLLELGTGAVGLLCISSGAALAFLGRHVADRVTISKPWTHPLDRRDS